MHADDGDNKIINVLPDADNPELIWWTGGSCDKETCTWQQSKISCTTVLYYNILTMMIKHKHLSPNDYTVCGYLLLTPVDNRHLHNSILGI